MKKLLVLVACLLAARFSPAGEISLAVTRVEPIGVERDIARTVEELLQTEFARVPIFQIVERGQLDAVLAEQELQLSGITSATSAARAGNVLNVQKVLFGSISLYESEYVKYLLSLRLVDVEKASVEAAETVQVRSKEDLLSAVKAIVQRLSANIQIVGRVTRVDGAEVYTSLGAAAGVAPEAVLSVLQIELIKDEQGQLIMREENPVANLVVEKVSPEGSRCRILASAAQVQSGYTVRKGEIALEREEGSSTLVVRSVPEGANVYLNSQFLGLTPMELGGLAPGKYEVEIRSGAGYKPYQGRITLGAGRTVTLERELERELEIEDLLLLGKVPRRPTDPGTALKRSLVPGGGMIYNGYGSLAPFVPFTVIMPMAVGFASFAEPNMFALADVKALAEGGDDAATYEYFAAKNRWIEDTLLFAWSLHSYGTSIFDAWRSARQDFRYPSYFSLASGLSG
ncbi:MAG: PEGA domain-containing protein, partial [bacterium]